MLIYLLIGIIYSFIRFIVISKDILKNNLCNKGYKNIYAWATILGIITGNLLSVILWVIWLPLDIIDIIKRSNE